MSDQSHNFLYHKTEKRLARIVLPSRLQPSIQTTSGTQAENQNQNGRVLSQLQNKPHYLLTSQEIENTPETEVEEDFEKEKDEESSEDSYISPLTLAQPRGDDY